MRLRREGKDCKRKEAGGSRGWVIAHTAKQVGPLPPVLSSSTCRRRDLSAMQHERLCRAVAPHQLALLEPESSAAISAAALQPQSEGRSWQKRAGRAPTTCPRVLGQTAETEEGQERRMHRPGRSPPLGARRRRRRCRPAAQPGPANSTQAHLMCAEVGPAALRVLGARRGAVAGAVHLQGAPQGTLQRGAGRGDERRPVLRTRQQRGPGCEGLKGGPACRSSTQPCQEQQEAQHHAGVMLSSKSGETSKGNIPLGQITVLSVPPGISTSGKCGGADPR